MNAPITHTDPVAPAPPEPRPEPKKRWPVRILRKDGTVELPLELMAPVLGAVLGWWRQGSPEQAATDTRNERAVMLITEAVNIVEFGRRYGYCERTIYNFIDLGLPTIGKGRLRRVPLKEGGDWLRNHLAEVAADPLDAAVDADLRSRNGT